MDNVTQAQEWQRFAAMDLDSAEYLLKMHPVPIEIICYHCQLMVSIQGIQWR
ncbi:hypothetical protein [Desulfosporosinus sp.]|uniref:hypothetical protein n=1 Tax=Desulfosporosinus sp. TaxID=157907 RepID=UPI002609985A|nr:hypothetical protein [Desulfosporosinus sp.]